MSGKSRPPYVAGRPCRDARWTNWTRRLAKKVSPPTKRASDRPRCQSIYLILSPANGRAHVLALDIPGVFESLTKCAQTVRVRVRRCWVEKADHRHRWLLRARRKRPRSSRAAEQRVEIAPSHRLALSGRGPHPSI